ncbi:hypothetical protein E2C01_098583 [Portunus trituberculatus]|uniref:Uncharacterized protein n=1 Tax=Portunus trituberculatus TaxID=210409 RepID=A0A5B7JY72_PORTR|nr:hypothetical protein [Portunus trituberculatus]
MRRRLERLT